MPSAMGRPIRMVARGSSTAALLPPAWAHRLRGSSGMLWTVITKATPKPQTGGGRKTCPHGQAFGKIVDGNAWGQKGSWWPSAGWRWASASARGNPRPESRQSPGAFRPPPTNPPRSEGAGEEVESQTTANMSPPEKPSSQPKSCLAVVKVME